MTLNNILKVLVFLYETRQSLTLCVTCERVISFMLLCGLQGEPEKIKNMKDLYMYTFKNEHRATIIIDNKVWPLQSAASSATCTVWQCLSVLLCILKWLTFVIHFMKRGAPFMGVSLCDFALHTAIFITGWKAQRVSLFTFYIYL